MSNAAKMLRTGLAGIVTLLATDGLAYQKFTQAPEAFLDGHPDLDVEDRRALLSGDRRVLRARLLGGNVAADGSYSFAIQSQPTTSPEPDPRVDSDVDVDVDVDVETDVDTDVDVDVDVETDVDTDVDVDVDVDTEVQEFALITSGTMAHDSAIQAAFTRRDVQFWSKFRSQWRS